MNIFRRKRNGRTQRLHEMWVVMRNGDPKFLHTYMGGAMGTLMGEYELDGLEWFEQREVDNKILILSAEEPDGTYWEVIRTPIGLNA